MAIRLPQPPRDLTNLIELGQWLENIWNHVRGTVVVTGDAVATIGSGETYHGITALSATRTITMAPAASYQDGDEIIIQDESGAAGTYTVTISRSGSDTINGGASVTITSNYGRRRIIKRGAGKFYSA